MSVTPSAVGNVRSSATATTVRTMMSAGAGMVAGDMAGITGTMARDTVAGTAGITGTVAEQERGFGPFLVLRARGQRAGMLQDIQLKHFSAEVV